MTKILLAEDHAGVRKSLVQLIRDEFPEAHITDVEDGWELLTAIKRETFDIVISDLSMPIITGLEALPYIKQINASLPVLLISTHPANQYSGIIEAAGAKGYLQKDSAPEELGRAIGIVLSGGNYF